LPIIKPPIFLRGSGPNLGRWMRYLASGEKREIASLRDGFGKEIDSEDAIERLGGRYHSYWTSIVAPSENECSILITRYGGDLEQATLRHGEALSSRIQKELKLQTPPIFAFHVEAVRDTEGRDTGRKRFHFHFTGEGDAGNRLYGKDGVLQRCWDREWDPDRKPILDWNEHRNYLRLKKELLALGQEQRQLLKDRREALKGLSDPAARRAVHDRFRDREIALATRRHGLEVETCGARYGARLDRGSVHHQAELEKVHHRRTAALNRAQFRGKDRRPLLDNQRAVGRGVSVAKRQALRLALKAQRLLQTAMAAPGPHDRSADKALETLRPVEALAKSAASELVSGTLEVGAEAARAAAMAATKGGLRVASASAKLGAGLVLALPTGGASLKAGGKEAGKDLAEGAREAGQELGRGAANASREAGKAAGRALGSALSGGLTALPRPAQEAIRAGMEAGKTLARTGRSLVTLDLGGAVGNAVTGGLATSKRAAGLVLEGGQGLPAALRMPIKSGELVPVVGLPLKALRATLDLAATMAPTPKQSAGLDLER